ncbi:hypothetical protein QBC40DRAFT_320102 [Triangularia verruculosa]|uniref:Uncharacterized protein n=1 Tax=Triangularia verruculosa TaxID=2587418 RepID=A0AAN6XTF1_9PEZI|nr:hypothetical protein QBC40DRAFT_320102 [Triangularia verruculosa]
MPSLQTLPFELLEQVTKSLCLRCTRRPSCRCSSDCIIDVSTYKSSICHTRPSWDPEARTRALGALCLTSHRLKDAATRHLYHHPHTKKWWLLAGTLLRQPRLARDVKTLYLPDKMGVYLPEKAALPPEFLSFYQAQLDHYSASVPEDEFRQRRDQRIWEINGDNDIVAMLSSLCPAVETIEAVVTEDVVFHLCPPASLPSLRTVELGFWGIEGEGGIPLRSLVPLFKAAPNLVVLRCHSMSDEEGGVGLGVTAGTVEEVEFLNSAISADALRSLLEGCPGLKTFRYAAGSFCAGFAQFRWSQARDLIIEHAPRLERVVIDFAGLVTWDSLAEWEGWDEEQTEREVKSFKGRRIEFEVTGIHHD